MDPSTYFWKSKHTNETQQVGNVDRILLSLENFNERTLHITLRKVHFVILLPFQNIAPYFADLHLKSTVHIYNREKRLESCTTISGAREMEGKYSEKYLEMSRRVEKNRGEKNILCYTTLQ